MQFLDATSQLLTLMLNDRQKTAVCIKIVQGITSEVTIGTENVHISIDIDVQNIQYRGIFGSFKLNISYW